MKLNKKLLGAAVSGILLASMSISANAAAGLKSQPGPNEGECHGVNACHGQGDCQGVRSNGTKYSCAGNNECKGSGYKYMTKEGCDQKGGNFKESSKA